MKPATLPRPAPRAPAPELPPHDLEIEAAALGAVIFAGISNSQAEVDALLMQLRPLHFYDLRHRVILTALAEMRGGPTPHAIDLVTVYSWLHDQKQLEAAGGRAYVTSLIDKCPSLVQFCSYVAILEEKRLRRWCLKKAAALADRAGATEISLEVLQTEFAEVYEQTSRAAGARPMIEVWTVADAQAYKPDPRTFLIGANFISHGELSVIAGPPGVGKSRLAKTLAFAGARGSGEWMGYTVRRRFRTLVLQSEDSPLRISSEVAALPAADFQDYVRISLPCHMEFANPKFRQALRSLWESWRFDCLIVDNMNDVARADGREEYLEGLASIQAALPTYPHTPAIVIVAHLRKSRGGEGGWRPKTGRQMLDELSGSLALGAKARTILWLQPGSNDMADDRVTFGCCKSNNEQPLPDSAWHRRNGEFQPCPGFDWDAWINPPDEARKVVTLETLGDVFDGGKRRLARRAAVVALEEAGFASATAYRALDPKGKFAKHLSENDGLLSFHL